MGCVALWGGVNGEDDCPSGDVLGLEVRQRTRHQSPISASVTPSRNPFSSISKGIGNPAFCHASAPPPASSPMRPPSACAPLPLSPGGVGTGRWTSWRGEDAAAAEAPPPRHRSGIRDAPAGGVQINPAWRWLAGEAAAGSGGEEGHGIAEETRMSRVSAGDGERGRPGWNGAGPAIVKIPGWRPDFITNSNSGRPGK